MQRVDRTIRTSIEDNLNKGKVIVIYGARQVGKTTLVKMIQEKHSDSKYINCDEIDIRQAFEDKTSTELRQLVGKSKMLIIDEAQRIKNIGLTLKLMVDNFPEIQVIATGSSSFDLSSKIKEPLTGRKFEYHLYPMALQELNEIYSPLEINRLLETRMIFGMYPEIISDNEVSLLKNLADSYLYKDVLQYQNIKNPEILIKLLQALALQIGKEVSYNELSSMIGVDKNTVANYITILEKAFIIFRLQPFSRNLKNEIKKLRKIFFYDLGIRNALINNFNPLDLRQDSGDIFENFIIAERIKYNSNIGDNKNIYFWRTHNQKEIDYIEESRGEIMGYEIKLGKGSWQPPKEFTGAYKKSTVELINKINYQSFVGISS